jgi:hypothetical protein
MFTQARGSLTTYDIEFIYDFLGEKRINQKLEELKSKPTMGTTFYDFLFRSPEYSYFSGKGKLWVFSILVDWFKPDLDLHLFLYNKSRDYNEENYHNGKLLAVKWEEYQKSMDRMILRNPEKKEYWANQKVSSYWIEYHFFIHSILGSLIKYKSDPKIESLIIQIFKHYFESSDKITSRFKLNDWPQHGLSNNIFMKMEEFYIEKGDSTKVSQIKERARIQGWRPFIF